MMKAKVDKFSPSAIGVDSEKIPIRHRPAIRELVLAARIMDRLFLHQVSAKNPSVREEIAASGLEHTLAYFDIMYGPWDRLDGNKPFFGGAPKPEGAGFYPEDMTNDELDSWLALHPEDTAAFQSYFTVIERDGDMLRATPYSAAYRSFLSPAVRLLRDAAKLALDERLARYLEARAFAFETNEYRESDMAWMDLGDGDLEVVIGPYEVYEDRLLGLKASFEAFIGLRDPEDSRKLAAIASLLPDMEVFLPIPDEHKNPSRGLECPISVIDLLFSAGDTRASVQTLAFNLPNDEVVREKKGSKKVMLKNVAKAKFEKILWPIAERLVREDQQKKITFDAFFHHTLLHETAHGLGPGTIEVDDQAMGKRKTTVNLELKDLYSVIEEAKADVLGMYLNYMLIEQGVLQESFEEEAYASYVGGFFRSIRFGAEEAHAKGNLIQLGYLLEKDALTRDPDGRYGYVASEMRSSLESLARDLLMLEARGDYEGAARFIERYAVMPENLKAALAELGDIPVDIRPIYLVEEQMKGW